MSLSSYDTNNQSHFPKMKLPDTWKWKCKSEFSPSYFERKILACSFFYAAPIISCLWKANLHWAWTLFPLTCTNHKPTKRLLEGGIWLVFPFAGLRSLLFSPFQSFQLTQHMLSEGTDEKTANAVWGLRLEVFSCRLLAGPAVDSGDCTDSGVDKKSMNFSKSANHDKGVTYNQL